MQIKQAVAERFLMLCQEAKITPNELATKSGVTPSTVYSMLDLSREDVYMTTIKKLCDGLDITLGRILQHAGIRCLGAGNKIIRQQLALDGGRGIGYNINRKVLPA